MTKKQTNGGAETAGVFRRGAARGMVAGAVGVVVMTLAEKVEQQVTGRPDSEVPARTLQRVLGHRDDPGRRWLMNPVMHFGQAVMLGSLRGVMAEAGLRGPWSSAMFTVVRLTNDQTLENATGIGAPPWTWPRKELAIDVMHKAIYAFATGVVADRLAAATGPGPGMRHAQKRPGRHEDVGP